jgi:predicted HTH domain antitoxin
MLTILKPGSSVATVVLYLSTMYYNVYMTSISARIPDEDEEELRKVTELLDEDRSSTIRKALREGLEELRVRVAIEQYQSGNVSANEAARIAGVSIAEWLEIARERNLTTQLQPEDIESDADSALEI